MTSKNTTITPTQKPPQFHPPTPTESFILTISVGNTHLHWATHHGASDDYNPKIFWRTPHINQHDLTTDSHVRILSRLIPDDAHDYIFGKDEEASVDAARRESEARGGTLISVYVVSTNVSQADLLERLVKSIPSRYYLIGDDLFFTKAQGRYEGMGTDRLATLAGAVHQFGNPALVFDGGTACTYSATDWSGKIIGGGIGPGLGKKLECMASNCAALPRISREEVEERIGGIVNEDKKALSVFATNTKEAMMSDVFQEMAMKGRNVIGCWLKRGYKNKPSKSGGKLNIKKKVMCTGGDGDILQYLLMPGAGGLVETDEMDDLPEYEVEVSKHLIHYGIAAVLYNHSKLQQKKSEFANKPNDEHVGKRVAKVFDVEADDGDNVFRGTVSEVFEVDGQTEYRISYDDGDVEDVSKEILFDMFELFSTHGEKAPQKQNGKSKATKKKNKEEKKPHAIPSDTSTKASSKSEKKPKKPKKKKVDTDSENEAPPPKKSKTIDPITSMVNTTQPTRFVGRRVAKDFDGETYFGTIMEYDDSDEPPLWKIQYDDGDGEEFEKKELIEALRLYEEEGGMDPSVKGVQKPAS